MDYCEISKDEILYKLDTKKMNKILKKFISDDLYIFGKPALFYNFIHGIKKGLIINSIDNHHDWLKERKSLENQGLTLRVQKANHIMNINNNNYNIIVYTFQPLNKNKVVDEDILKSITVFTLDPLAISIGFMISGFCYLKFIKNN